MADLTVTGENSVDKKIEAGGNSLEIEIVFLILFLNVDVPVINAAGIFVGNMGRIGRERIFKI